MTPAGLAGGADARGGDAGTLLFGRYDAAALLGMFEEAGVVEALGRRGFTDPGPRLDDAMGPLLHVRLDAWKDGARHALLDACLTEASLDPGRLGAAVSSCSGAGKVHLLVVQWLREEDPTAEFEVGHPRLPLQEHPGLGILKRAFRVALRLARESGKDGIAALPKYFHDAAIFHRSRLFLFVDPVEQGCFEALLRDLGDLSLGEASMALVRDEVRDQDGALRRWTPGLQVMPLTDALVAVFHAPAWQEACAAALASHRYRRVPCEDGGSGPAGPGA